MAQIDRTDGLVGNAAIKYPCRMASTANLVLSGLQTIDGVVGAQDDRVLVKNQTTATQNGIYVMDSGTWERAQDADNDGAFTEGSLVKVNNGTVGSGFWYITNTGTITIDTTNIAFAKASTVLAIVSAFWQNILTLATAALSRAQLGLDTGDSPTFAALTVTGTATAGAVTTTGAMTAATVAGAAVATQANQETATSVATIVTPGRQQYHPSASKGWANFGLSGNISASYNVSSVTDVGTGIATVNWTTSFSSGAYSTLATVDTNSATTGMLADISNATVAAGSVTFRCLSVANGGTVATADPTGLWCVSAFGDQ